MLDEEYRQNDVRRYHQWNKLSIPIHHESSSNSQQTMGPSTAAKSTSTSFRHGCNVTPLYVQVDHQPWRRRRAEYAPRNRGSSGTVITDKSYRHPLSPLHALHTFHLMYSCGVDRPELVTPREAEWHDHTRTRTWRRGGRNTRGATHRATPCCPKREDRTRKRDWTSTYLQWIHSSIQHATLHGQTLSSQGDKRGTRGGQATQEPGARSPRPTNNTEGNLIQVKGMLTPGGIPGDF